MMLFVAWMSRVVLGGVFIYGGYTKVQAELQFAAAIAAYRLVPDRFLLPADYRSAQSQPDSSDCVPLPGAS